MGKVKIDEQTTIDFLNRNHIPFRKESCDSGTKIVLKQCVFDKNHKQAAIFINHDGSVRYTCFHDSCKKYRIFDFFRLFEPDFMKDENFGKKIKAKSRSPEEKSAEEYEEIAKKIVKTAAEVEKKKTQWFLNPIIPKCNITLLAAEGGAGKTSIAVSITAAVTRGKLPSFMGNFENLPFDDMGDGYGNQIVMYLTSEDPMSEVLRERFEVAGADLTKIRFVGFEEENFADIKFDGGLLEALIKIHRPALCIFDPIQSFILGKMGERNVMRQNLDALTRLAQLYECTFFIICHTNKMTINDARTKISDSSDLWDKARSVLMVGSTKDDDIKYLSQEKSNYSELDDTYLFCIASNGNVVYKGRSEKRYADFSQEEQKQRTSEAKDEAKRFILTSLREGEMMVHDLDDSAKAIGISKQTLNRAKRELREEHLITYRQEAHGQGNGVVWYIGSLQPKKTSGNSQ